MDGPSGHYANKLNKSDRQRQRKYDFTCMNLKNKTKEQIKQKRNRLIDIEGKKTDIRWRRNGLRGVWVKDIKRHKLSVVK